jgi:hypothetical protein
VFARFAHLDLVDALYFSVTIITTAVGLSSAVTSTNVHVVDSVLGA